MKRGEAGANVTNRVLVIRQARHRQAVQLHLQDLPCSEASPDGIVGLAGLTPYDLIILDLKLPGIDGLGSAAVVRAAATPILMLTLIQRAGSVLV
jgi:DNA-binding response OmpR family regulator